MTVPNRQNIDWVIVEYPWLDLQRVTALKSSILKLLGIPQWLVPTTIPQTITNHH